jgi:thioredoxin 1
MLLLVGLAGFCALFLVTGQKETLASSGTIVADLISGAPQTVPIPGTVTMVDLGAHSCIPCKMMAPIIKELSAEYSGRAAIVFIDVWENPNVPPQFGLRAIPTQIFYDAEGKERFRHEGFMDKESIVEKLKKLGVN